MSEDASVKLTDKWMQEAEKLENTNTQSPDTGRSNAAKASTLRLCAYELYHYKERDLSEKETAVDNLLEAVGQYVESIGGKALVAGGIEIITFPGDPKLIFRVSIKCTGRKPKPK